MKYISKIQMVEKYCETQAQNPLELCHILDDQIEKYNPDGFMLLRCVMLDSSYFGSRAILPYGPNNTFKTPADKPFSPRGLASDISEVEAIWIVPKTKQQQHHDNGSKTE